MNVIIVPGYGDRTAYIEHATRNWIQKYDLKPVIYVIGWNNDVSNLEGKWKQLASLITNMDETAIIGISAGASVALRALQTYPDTVKKVITICGPVHKHMIHAKILHNRYPMLEESLDRFDLTNIDTTKVMTIRPIFDDAVTTKAMKIEGALDKRLTVAFHAIAILWAMYTQGSTISKFINGYIHNPVQ